MSRALKSRSVPSTVRYMFVVPVIIDLEYVMPTPRLLRRKHSSKSSRQARTWNMASKIPSY